MIGALVLTAACTPQPGLDGARLYQPGVVDIALPVASVQQRKFQTVIQQQYDFSCGSGALATLLRFHYGDPQNEQSVFLGMWREGDRAAIRRLGFSLLDMKRYLAGRGIAADGYKVTLEQIARVGSPGIALVDTQGYKHFVVVKGFDNGRVLVGDPALGLRRITTGEFSKIWNGVYFVINARAGSKTGSFASPTEWALAPGAPSFAPTEPLSQAALSLTRPILGDI
ncbi:C39 family peptidase [Sandarakinorhabdus glacialis]|uniref:C39 family peptidase n=1 Tax=Sandarakinorhabdus glacialis TaxID=1614636 RepID=UPI001FB165F1|nr:C39 family peptidase [Polymorphobacter glacialis]